MITTAERRRRPYLTIAVVLSLLVHVIGMLIYLGLARQWLLLARKPPRQPDRMVATNDMITLEKRTIPRPTVRARPRPPQVQAPAARPQVVLQRPPQPKTPAQRHEIARIVARAPAQPRVTVTLPPAEPTQPSHARSAAAPAAGVAPSHELSPRQIARLDRQFQRTITQANSAVADVKLPKEPPATMKHYAFVMSGTPKDLAEAQGYVDPLQHWVDPVHHRNWYYVRVRVIYPDGTSEIVDIPWPISFPFDNDPIETERIFHHIPDPPPGYQLPHPFALSRLVCMYYKNECQAVIDREQAAGGEPVSN